MEPKFSCTQSRPRLCSMPQASSLRWTASASRSPFFLPSSVSARHSSAGWSLDAFHVLAIAIIIVGASALFIASDRAAAFFPTNPFLLVKSHASATPASQYSSVPSFSEINASHLQDVFGEKISDNEHSENPRDMGVMFSPKLPEWHANAGLLNSIRSKTVLSPRWPSGEGVDVHKLRSYGPAYSSVVVSRKLRVVYIPVFKVGTTSMMWQIAYLENNTHVLKYAHKPNSILQHFLHDMGTDAWKSHALCHMTNSEISDVISDPSFLKFTFVRNPYTRLISAYMDKVYSVAIESLEYQRQMYGLFGNDVAQRAKANETRPSFEAYVSAIHDVLMMPRTKSSDPKKDDFFEDNSSRRDVHWRPQVELVHADIIPVDFVGRFEHTERDQNVVLDWMYKHTVRRMPHDVSVNLHRSDPRAKQTLLNKLKTSTQLQQTVRRMYAEDFERFLFPSQVPDSL